MGRQTSIIRKRIEKQFYSHGDFLVVEDEKRPSTWRIRIAQNGIPSERLMRNAYAYLTTGFAGRVYKGPQKEQAMAKLRSMFSRMNKPIPGSKQAESATLIQKAADTPADELEEGVGEIYMDGDTPRVPWGVTSFEALLAANEAKEDANEVMVLAYQLTRIIENIVSSPDLQDQLGAITNAVNEFITLATDALSPSSTEESKPLGSPAGEASSAESDEAGSGASTDAGGDQLAESFAGSIDLVEIGEAATSGVPLTMTVGIIKPGWGNERDNHYYPAEVLRRDAHVFAGAKMYETDHKESERSTRSWVSTIDSIQGFAADGSPIAKVIVHDPNFAERLRALKAAGKLTAMECSILAAGRAKPGQIDGKQANVVEAITAAHAVDWVTKAGAGGRALDLAETASPAADPATPDVEQPTASADTSTEEAPAAPQSADNATPVDAGQAPGEEKPATDADAPKTDEEPEQPDETPATTDAPVDATLADASKTDETPAAESAPSPVVQLSEAQVLAELKNTRLPLPSQVRLKLGTYANAEALSAAIDAEIAYVKELTGSGQPVMQIGRTESTPTVVTAEVAKRNAAAINKRYFGH